MGKHGQGTHSTKMDADKSAENTQNAPKILGPICLLKPKSFEFSKKSLWVSVVYEIRYVNSSSFGITQICHE